MAQAVLMTDTEVMTAPKHGPLLVTLGTVAAGTAIATGAFWINGLEEASWFAAVVTLPLTVASLIVALLQRAPISLNRNRQRSDSRDESERNACIHQRNNRGDNIIQQGPTNIILTTRTREDPKKG